MTSTVDMTYRFLWDSEPSDEQLQVIMEEVAEEARQQNEAIRKMLLENLERESAHRRYIQHKQPS